MTGAAEARHVPVLLDEVVAALAPQPGDVIVDATFGAGGYTRALLDAGATVHAFDRDPDAIAAGREWPETAEQPPRLVSARYQFVRSPQFAWRGDGRWRLVMAAPTAATW